MFQVYQLSFSNGSYYIGSTSNLKRRISAHRRSCLGNKPTNKRLSHTWRKWGEPSIILMGTYDEAQNMLDAEQFYLNVSIGDKDCLNQNPNADRGGRPKGVVHSAEAKAKMQQSHANPIIAISPTGQITHHISATQAVRDLGLPIQSICRLLISGKTGKQRSTKGWRFEKEVYHATV